ncbi:hypothetical protein I307_05936 [Cryptococcus deuterogattii 99/473]|uniref:UAS domain-containing protein n=2 Tax=Cryptococcus deuterogattii TaxID=1859096 RepID=A0A0D0UY32_9TREE|nr:hypothetical protein CNBG_1607 [Cryptococcus deuterogattii R265]KIR40246.1 hypothetical protein I313_03568 [Cryptococcus deuterogattii Ram5]KIR71960.1 hypothetical protein I310_04010 [Cryptococcus deuterogattii CA1014]KIY54750.1 hypothetical protein I307_05936 [Cryptococcus deuterogattii 99/473]
MPLTTSQQQALSQLWAVTSSTTDAARERDERLLRENGWDVQTTIEQIFNMTDDADLSSPGGDAGPSTSRNRHAVHDPDQDPLLPPIPPGARRLSGTGARRQRPIPRAAPGTTGIGIGIWNIIVWPVGMLFSIVGGVWYFIVRAFVPLSFLPYIPSFLLPPSPSPPSIPRPPQDPTTEHLAFLQSLCSLTGLPQSELPEIYVGPYREFLTHIRKELLVGLVVLVSEEHEDDESFKKGSLADKDVVQALRSEGVVVWVADISSREGFQASQTLLATTYPSLTFLSLLPSTSSSPTTTSSSSPKLTLLNTLSGPPSTITSPTSIITTLQTAVLPRVRPFLNRLKSERLAVEEARYVRAEQDRAFRASEAKDRERMRVAKQKEEAERIKKEREEKERREKELIKEKRKIWRRYARKHLLPPSNGPVRVALRTPLSSERHLHHFTPSSSTLSLYIFAETLLIPASAKKEDDPDTPPEGYDPLAYLSSSSSNTIANGAGISDILGEEEVGDWPFTLVTAYPRQTIPCVLAEGEKAWETVQKAGGAMFLEKREGYAFGLSEEEEDGESEEEIVSDSD